MANINRDWKQTVTGELGGETSATQGPDVRAEMVMFKACVANTGNVYIGATSGVTAKNGTTDATTGLELDAGQSTGWIPVTGGNLDSFHYICSGGGDDITYIALSR